MGARAVHGLSRLHGLPALLAGPRRLAEWVAEATGWRRRLIAVGLGAAAALALPPFHLVPLLLVAFPGLVWLLDGSRRRWAAFGAGWWWGLGFFTLGLYWVSYALLTDPSRYGWMVPFVVIGLGAGMALFIGATTLLVHLTGIAGIARVAMLAASWVLVEWVRSWVLTGFPWNLMGTVWAATPPMLQVAALAGAYGLGLVTVLVAAMPAVLADDTTPRKALAAVLAAAALLAVVWTGGAVRLAGAPAEMVPGVRLRLVQPAVPQTVKWQEDLREKHLADTLALTRGPGFEAVTTVIWPETAVAFFLEVDDAHRALAATAVPPGGYLLTGVVRITPRGVTPLQVWNSLMAIDAGGRVVADYDKVHLVPFGEYMPFQGLLPLKKLTAGMVDFTPGAGPATIGLVGLPPFSPTICYEAIFPAAVTRHDGAGPAAGWLLNVTNDGWFGLSAGPHQHLAAARLRAVEEGLPMVRAANTGISSIIDPYGRTVALLALGERGVLDGPLPVPVAGGTPFGRFGNALPLAIIGMVAAAAWLFSRMRRPTRRA